MTYVGKLPISNSYYWATNQSIRQPAFSNYVSNSFQAPNTLAFEKLSITLNNPIAVYHFENNINDYTANGNNLIVSAGSLNYSKRMGNKIVFFFDGTNRIRSSTNTPFILTGALTIQMIMKVASNTALDRAFIEFGANGETLATNVLYSYYTRPTPVNNGFYYLHESGSGTNYEGAFPTASYVPYEWSHVTFTRASDGRTNKVYINGKQIGSSLVSSQPPAGGTSSQLYIGGKVSIAEFSMPIYMDSFKIHNTELTEQQILEEYNYCFNVTSSVNVVPTIAKQFVCGYMTSSAGISAPATASFAYVASLADSYNNNIRLQSIITTNGAANTGSIKLYNVTSGAYVHINANSTTLSMIGNQITVLTSSNLLNATNFVTNSLYRLEYYGEGSAFNTILYGTEIIYK